jgi:hypothetical protein
MAAYLHNADTRGGEAFRKLPLSQGKKNVQPTLSVIFRDAKRS